MSTVIDNGFSFEFQNNVRSVHEEFMTLVAQMPTFLSLVGFSSVTATNTKDEWIEDTISPKASAISGFDTDGDGTGVNVASTVGFTAKDIIRFTTSTGASETEIAKITSVDSSTDLTIERDYGSSTGVTLVVGDVINLVSSPRAESSSAVEEDGQEPAINFNFTEIFDAVATVSKTQQNVRNYGIADMMDKQVFYKLKELAYKFNQSGIYGRRVARSGSENGTMGGVLQFLESGNVKDVGGAVSTVVLNDILEDIFEDGGMSNNYTFLCHNSQARKISEFNKAGVANGPVRTAQEDRSFGGRIETFVGDLPVRGGFTASVVVDPLFPKDQIAILDMEQIEIAPLQNREFTETDATQPGDDKLVSRILGEYTMRVMNGQKAHGLLTGLTF